MAEILLYGIIGSEADKLDARTVTQAIRSATGPLSVRINSPGGYVMEGLAIVQALRDYPGKVTIYIDGLAASMASVIAMVGTEIIMAESALMMIHSPWDSTIGNADDMRRDAAKLDKVEAQLIGIYVKRTGLPESRIAAMLAAETWLTAQEAHELGFVTAIAAPLQIAACAIQPEYGFRNTPAQLKDPTMSTTTTTTKPPVPSDPVALERVRVSTILNLGTKHDVPADSLHRMIDAGTPLDDARAAILDYLASRDDAANIGHNAPGLRTFDNPEFHAQAASDAIYARLSGKAPTNAAARELMGVSMVDIAREMLDKRGVRNVIRMRADQVLHPENWGRGASAAFITTTTGDFPTILQGAGQRFILDQYAAAASVLKQVARKRDVRDFREITGVQVGGFGLLETVNEAGEFKNGSFTERAEKYKISAFGKMFNLSRQSIINDDLGAFSDVLTVMGRAAAETEAVNLVALLLANPVMADGNAVFSAAHNNLAATNEGPDPVSLSKARIAMRTQKDLDGKTPLNVLPKFIVAGATQETSIETSLATITPATAADVNVFSGRLTPLIEPRITGNAWYLFGDPATSPPVLEVACLNGETEPFLDQQEGWRVDGVEYKVRHDFGAAFVDWKGAYKNPGFS